MDRHEEDIPHKRRKRDFSLYVPHDTFATESGKKPVKPAEIRQIAIRDSHANSLVNIQSI